MKNNLINSLQKHQLRQVINNVDPTANCDKWNLDQCREFARQFSYKQIVDNLK